MCPIQDYSHKIPTFYNPFFGYAFLSYSCILDSCIPIKIPTFYNPFFGYAFLSYSCILDSCIPILFLCFGFMHFKGVLDLLSLGSDKLRSKEILDEKINKSHLILKFLYFFFKIPSGALQALHFCIHSGPLVYKYFKSCFYLVQRKKTKTNAD
jgi:hypothetical protein